MHNCRAHSNILRQRRQTTRSALPQTTTEWRSLVCKRRSPLQQPLPRALQREMSVKTNPPRDTSPWQCWRRRRQSGVWRFIRTVVSMPSDQTPKLCGCANSPMWPVFGEFRMKVSCFGNELRKTQDSNPSEDLSFNVSLKLTLSPLFQNVVVVVVDVFGMLTIFNRPLNRNCVAIW